MPRSALGSPRTTCVLASLRKQKCFMLTMDWPNRKRPRNRSSPQSRWVPAKVASALIHLHFLPRLHTLVVVAYTANKGCHAVFLVPACLSVAGKLAVPGKNIAHDVWVLQSVCQVLTVVLLVTRLPPAVLDPVAVLPSAVGLKVGGILGIDVGEGEMRADAVDVARVQDRTWSWLWWSERMCRQDWRLLRACEGQQVGKAVAGQGSKLPGQRKG